MILAGFIIFTLIIYLEKKIFLLKKYKIKYYFSIIFVFFFYIFLPNHLVQPFYSKISTESLKFTLEEKCDMKNTILTEKDIFINKKDIQFGSILLKNFSSNCHSSLEKKISRKIKKVCYFIVKSRGKATLIVKQQKFMNFK